MTTLITPYPPFPEPGEHERLAKEAVGKLGFAPSDPWGHLWIRQGKVYILVPWSRPEELVEPAIAFLDESYDRDSNTLLYGGLVFLPLPIIIATAQFVKNLLTLCELHPELWPGDVSPPRLHLREFHPLAARDKTPWRHVSESHLNLLIRAIVSIGVTSSAARYVFPVNQTHLKDALEANAADLYGPGSVPDLAIQAAAIQLRIAWVHSFGNAIPARLVVDHDATQIAFGRRRRQKTLRFLDSVMSGGDETVPHHGLTIDQSGRHSSRFPNDFRLTTLLTRGYPVRDLFSSVGLQFADLFLGLWRQLSLHHTCLFGVSLSDLGNPIIQTIDWFDKNLADPR